LDQAEALKNPTKQDKLGARTRADRLVRDHREPGTRFHHASAGLWFLRPKNVGRGETARNAEGRQLLVMATWFSVRLRQALDAQSTSAENHPAIFAELF
jgi:hypothetical protein